MGELSNIAIIVAGIVIVSIHIAVAFTTNFLFGVLIAFYAIGFAVVAIVFLQKKKKCMSQLEYEIGIYSSIFIIIINVFMVMYVIYSLMRPYQNISYSNYNSRYSSRY